MLIEFKAVQSTREISKRIADYLELADPAGYPASERAKTVRAVNDILQGRGERGMDSLLAELEQKCGESYADKIAGVRRDMEVFMDQKAAMFHAYTLTGKKRYKYKLYDRGSEPPLKIVNQRIFDRAANGGFPPDFFEGAYFDHVTIYCLPDSTHCVDCIFDGCTFAACRMVARFSMMYTASSLALVSKSSVIRAPPGCVCYWSICPLTREYEPGRYRCFSAAPGQMPPAR